MSKQAGKLVDKVDDAFYLLAEWAINWRLAILSLAFIFLIVGGYFASKARIDNSLESFFDQNDPAYISYLEYLDDFVSDEVVYILYHAPSSEHGLFDLDVMSTIADLTNALAFEVPFARKATSLANVEFLRPAGKDEIVVDELLIDFPRIPASVIGYQGRSPG